MKIAWYGLNSKYYAKYMRGFEVGSITDVKYQSFKKDGSDPARSLHCPKLVVPAAREKEQKTLIE